MYTLVNYMTFPKLDALEQNLVRAFDTIITEANLPQDKHRIM